MLAFLQESCKALLRDAQIRHFLYRRDFSVSGRSDLQVGIQNLKRWWLDRFFEHDLRQTLVACRPFFRWFVPRVLLALLNGVMQRLFAKLNGQHLGKRFLACKAGGFLLVPLHRSYLFKGVVAGEVFLSEF